MNVLAIAGTKASPGATTLALAIAASATSTPSPLLIEADPAGGDIAARAGLALDPGLLTLAAAGRKELTASLVERHTQVLPTGIRALLAPTSSEHAQSTLSGISPGLARVLMNNSLPAIIDVGRWDERSMSTALLSCATHALLVLRPTIEAVDHARGQLRSLSAYVEHVAVVSVGERPYAPAEVRAALEIDNLHVVDYDARAATAIGSGAPPDRWLRRSSLLRSASALTREFRFDVETTVGAR